jgi:hypothetical protein
MPDYSQESSGNKEPANYQKKLIIMENLWVKCINKTPEYSK